MAKEDDILKTLIDAGAMIRDQRQGMLSLPIYAELITEPPEGLFYYVQAGAEDQHHTHAIPFSEADIVHDRDLALRAHDGSIVAYVAPIAEWPQIDVDSTHESFAFAKRYLSENPAYAESFKQFIDACRPQASSGQIY